MSKLLEQVIEILRERPEYEQEAAAKMLVDLLFGEEVKLEELDPETRAAVEQGLAQADRGEFVPEEEMKAFFAQFEAKCPPR
jgi:predicted transcriptional regulator